MIFKLVSKFFILVLTIASELEISYSSSVPITHKIIPVLDLQNYKVRPHFAESREFILENMAKGKHILVHCSSGMSRVKNMI